jgi:hypothetical protein
MNDEQTVEISAVTGQPKRSLRELYNRRALALYCKSVLNTVDDADPRKTPAIQEYNRQLALIDAQITEIEGKPPPVVVNLKPAVLFPKAGGLQL